MDKINEVLNADTSGDPESAIPALLNKNQLFFSMIYTNIRAFFDIDWDSPYDFPDLDHPIYPFTFISEDLTDIQDICDLAYDTYESSAFENFLHNIMTGEPYFVEENGNMYINSPAFPIWSFNPFLFRTYVEITEKTETECTLIWRYPDVERLNPPENGYEYYYYEKTYTAKYIDGSWKLDRVVFNNAI